MTTTETTFGTRTELSTLMTDLGSEVRFNLGNFNPSLDCFVLDKVLQLVETPVTNPVVHNSSSVLFSNSFKVFHNNLVSVKIGNNVFTNVVICPSHPTSFPTTKLFQQSLRRPCAFGLKFRTQIFELSFSLLDFSRIIKPAVGTDSEVIYSEINAENCSLRTTVLLSGVNLFRECEQEKTPPFFIHSEKTFLYIPIKVFGVTIGNTEFKFLPFFEQPKNQLIGFDVCTSWKVVSYGSSLDDGLSFCLLDHPTSLFQTTNSYLGWQFESLPDCLIDSIMEFEVLSNFMFPGIINTELEGFAISLDSRDNFLSWINPNLRSDGYSHNYLKTTSLYKPYPHLTSGEWIGASPPPTEVMGIRNEGVL